MFKDTSAFSGFSVDDLDRAKQFYGETLGVGITENPAGLELLLGNGTRVFVYPKENHEPATFTILNFAVEDVEAAVDALTEAGVQFEHYDEFPMDEKGIQRGDQGPTIAWFKDPAGNILSVLEQPAS